MLVYTFNSLKRLPDQPKVLTSYKIIQPSPILGVSCINIRVAQKKYTP